MNAESQRRGRRAEEGNAPLNLVLAALAVLVFGTGAVAGVGPLGTTVGGGIGDSACAAVGLFLPRECSPTAVAAQGTAADKLAKGGSTPATKNGAGVILAPGGVRPAGCYSTSVDQPVTLRMLLVPGTYEVLARALTDGIRNTHDEIIRSELELASYEQSLRRHPDPITWSAQSFKAWQVRNRLKDLRVMAKVLPTLPLADLDTVLGRHQVNLNWTTDGSKVTAVSLFDGRFDYGGQSWITWKKKDDPVKSPVTTLPATTNQVTSTADLEAEISVALVRQLSEAAGKVPVIGEAVKALTQASIPLRYKSRITVSDNARYTEYAPGPGTARPSRATVGPRHC